MRVLALLAVAVLSGCVTTDPVSPALLAMDNVELTTGAHNHQYVDRVTYKYNGTTTKGDNLPICVVQNVENRSVGLRGGTGSMYSSLNVRTTREAGGGDVLKYISDDRKTVFAEGVTSFDYTFMITNFEQALRYRLSAKVDELGLTAAFNQIENAQLEMGSMENTGYKKLGAWPNLQPEKAIQELKVIADNINQCLLEH